MAVDRGARSVTVATWRGAMRGAVINCGRSRLSTCCAPTLQCSTHRAASPLAGITSPESHGDCIAIPVGPVVDVTTGHAYVASASCINATERSVSRATRKWRGRIIPINITAGGPGLCAGYRAMLVARAPGHPTGWQTKRFSGMAHGLSRMTAPSCPCAVGLKITASPAGGHSRLTPTRDSWQLRQSWAREGFQISIGGRQDNEWKEMHDACR